MIKLKLRSIFVKKRNGEEKGEERKKMKVLYSNTFGGHEKETLRKTSTRWVV